MNTPRIHTGDSLTRADFDGHCQPAEATADMGDNYDDDSWRERTDDDNRAAATFWLGYVALCAVGILAAIVMVMP